MAGDILSLESLQVRISGMKRKLLQGVQSLTASSTNLLLGRLTAVGPAGVLTVLEVGYH